MRVVLIGDLGWEKLYHLGDEAMSEAAAEVLCARGVDVTLVGGNAEATVARYALDAVKRPGHRRAMSRKEKEEYLHLIDEAIADRAPVPEPAKQVWEAIEKSDGVVVGGGGNLNSRGTHHLYDRVAMARIAQRFNKPYFVSSQTVGPDLEPRDQDLVAEIIDAAVCFGAREGATAELARSLAENPDKVVHTMDDAMLLGAAPESRLMADLPAGKLAPKYVVGSFTHHSGTTGMNRRDYISHLTRILDETSQEFDLDVYLTPHLGNAVGEKKDDQLLNDQIASSSTTGRVTALPMIDARSTLTLTQGAEFTLSTRYHPVVFGAGLGVPAVGLVLSYYSSVRMRGALRNAGLSSLALPLHFWRDGGLLPALRSMQANRESLNAHLNEVKETRRADQLRWWDSIVDVLRGGEWRRPDDLKHLPEWDWPDVTGAAFDRLTAVSDELQLLRFEHKALERELDESRARTERLANRIRAAREALR